MPVARSLAALLAGCALALACGDDTGDDGALCVDLPAQDCAQSYPPTWDEVWAQTVQPSCTPGEDACHASANASGSQGGLIFSDQATSYRSLLDGGFLDPEDPGCSDFMVRMLTEDPVLRMPPGMTVDEGHLCSITRWIEAGAPEG